MTPQMTPADRAEVTAVADEAYRLATIMAARVAGQGRLIRLAAIDSGDSLRITVEDYLVTPGNVGDAWDIDADLVSFLFATDALVAPAWWPGHFDGWDLDRLLRFRSVARAAEWIAANLVIDRDDNLASA